MAWKQRRTGNTNKMTKGRAAAAFGSHSLRKAETKTHKAQAGSRGLIKRKPVKGMLPVQGLRKSPGASWLSAEKAGHTSKWETPRKESKLLWEVRPKILPQAARDQVHRFWKQSKTPVYSTAPLSSGTGRNGLATHVSTLERIPGPHSSPRLSSGPERLRPASCHPVG